MAIAFPSILQRSQDAGFEFEMTYQRFGFGLLQKHNLDKRKEVFLWIVCYLTPCFLNEFGVLFLLRNDSDR